MKKRLTFLFLIAALTAGGIVIFQCYWVYNTYQTSKRNLNKQLSDALQKSIDKYHVQQSELPLSLKSQAPFISVLHIIKKDTTLHKTVSVYKIGKHSPPIADIVEVPVNPANLDNVKVMLAETQFTSASVMNTVKLDSLKNIFKTELKRNNIDLPFELTLLKSDEHLPVGKVAAYLNFSKSSPIVEASIDNVNKLLLIQNIIPAIISLVLVMLTAGSLCYMWLVIMRQMKLDHIKSDFINNVTHELRTPVSILKSTHEALFSYNGITDPEKTERYLKINTDILNQLDHNIDRILDIATYESSDILAERVPVNINDLTDAIIERFTAATDCTIHFFNPQAIQTVLTDSYMIDTIISNLADNAIKYASEPVSINITACYWKSGWELVVQDNGPGMADKHLPFIFDKFYRVQSNNLYMVKGYGLGLSYVKQLVSCLNGSISVKSKLNFGTTFTMRFP